MKRALFALLLLASLAACDRRGEQSAQFLVFGTLVDVQLRDTNAATAARAFQELQQRFQTMHRDWHAWEPGSLADINSAFASGAKAEAPPDLRVLIQRSQELEKASLGYFNPACGALVRMWGFHTSDYPVKGPPPTRDRIQAWLQWAPSTADIHIDGRTVSSSNRAVQLDFGGIAKGMAVDIALQVLAAHGVDNAMVNAGGDLRARGRPDRPWRVGIQAPEGRVLAALEIGGDEAVFTSGVSQRYLEYDGGRYPHVLNPLTGYPVQGLWSATVIASEGVVADAAATALLAAGRDSWREVAQSMGIGQALVIDDFGRAFATPAMAARLQWPNGQPEHLSIVP